MQEPLELALHIAWWDGGIKCGLIVAVVMLTQFVFVLALLTRKRK